MSSKRCATRAPDLTAPDLTHAARCREMATHMLSRRLLASPALMPRGIARMQCTSAEFIRALVHAYLQEQEQG